MMLARGAPGAADERPNAPRIAVFVAAALFLDYALNTYNGAPDRRTLCALCAAIACSAAGVLIRHVRWRFRGTGPDLADRAWMTLAVAAVLYGGYALMSGPPVVAAGRAASVWRQAGIGGAVVLAVTALRRRPPLGRWHVPLLVAAYIVMGTFVIREAGTPSIDVYEFHAESLKALLAGKSPYSTTIPNLYANNAAHFYGTSLVAGGRVHVGYPYPPASLFLALPGHLLGDYRYALVAALAVAAGLVAHLHDGRNARAGAVLLLFCPRAFFVCEQGWTEPFVAMALAAVIFCAVRRRAALPFALGALLASKQYAALALPAFTLLFMRERSTSPAARHGSLLDEVQVESTGWFEWRELAATVAIALALSAAVSLPFLIADPRGFIDSVLLFQFRQPLRAESLSLLEKIPGGAVMGSALGLAAAFAGLAACLRRAPRDVGGLAGSLAFVFLVFFALAKQAFWNYYLFVVAAIACAVAALSTAAQEPRRGPNWTADRLRSPTTGGQGTGSR